MAGDVYRVLWRHKLLIAVLTTAFVGAAWYATSRQSLTYEASTLVRVQERGSRAGDASAALVASQTLAQTYAKIIGSGALEGEIKTLVAGCSRGKGSSANSVPAAPNRQHGSASTKGVPASFCKLLGGTSSSRVARPRLSKVQLSGSPIQDLDLLEIKARSKQPTSAMVVANAAPVALRRFVRKTGSPSEQIVIAKAATVPSSPVSRHMTLNIAIALMLGVIFSSGRRLAILYWRRFRPCGSTS
jgi:capsular polysaccharide biosynthesis protein